MATVTINRLEQTNFTTTAILPVVNATSNTRFRLTVNTLADIDIDWGDGVIEKHNENIDSSHNYNQPYTGNVTIIFNNSTPDVVETLEVRDWFNFNISIISQFKNIISFSTFSSTNTVITGDIAGISSLTSLRGLRLRRESVTGDISSLSSINSSLSSNSTIILDGTNTITGDIVNISNFREIQIEGNNTLFGNINVFTANDRSRIIIEGNNTITGDIKDITGLFRTNTTSNQIILTGNNTVFGNVSDIPINIGVCIINGDNTISGNIELAPSFNSLSIAGNNTIVGSLNNLQNSINSLSLEGSNSVTLNINDLSSTLFNSINISSNSSNLFSGDIINFQQNKRISIINPNINIGGTINLSNTNSTDGGIRLILTNINNNINYISNIVTLDSNQTFNFRITINNTSQSLSSIEVDSFIQDLDNSTFRKNNQSSLELKGGFSRTSNSDAAFNNLINSGMRIEIE